ncbi:MAG: ABC transporter permease [Bacillus sp. (in: firmicutes)]
MRNAKAFQIEIIGIVVASLAALLIGCLVILLVSDEPLNAINYLFVQPFTSLFQFGTILNKMVPLVLTGLAVAVVFRAGIFSMGAEGQLYVGAFTGALVAVYVTGIPSFIHIPIILLAAMLGGALFGLIPGLLKGYLNVDEIVTTLMLNYVGIYLVSYFLNYVFKDPNSGGFARMPYIEDSGKLQRFLEGLPTHSGIFIALLAVLITYLFLYRTKGGYEMRLVGQNKSFAEYGGINSKWIMAKSVVIGGILAGLAGIVEVMGTHGTLKDSFSDGLGFDGIIIALLARNHPLGVLLAAFFFAYLQVGAQLMQANSDVSRELAVIIQVLLVLFVSAQAIFTYLKTRRLTVKPSGGVKNVSNDTRTNA